MSAAYRAGQKAAAFELGLVKETKAKGITDAENVKKKTKYDGIPVHLDYPRGHVRRWFNDKGDEIYKVKYEHDYGFLPHVMGADGDHLDAYIGPHGTTPNAYVLDKLKHDGTLDEHKLFLGFKDEDLIKKELATWKTQYSIGKLRSMPWEELKAQLKKKKFTPPE